MTNIALQKIIDLIEPNSRVLDLGCGNGELLQALKEQKQVKAYGLEIDFANVNNCIQKGLSVFHGDLDKGLKEFHTQSFDYVILSQTLQEVKTPLLVLKEMLRVGKKGIVSFPNFGFWQIRLQLLLKGMPPVTQQIPYNWYDTPNIRVITLDSFRALCQAEQIQILKQTPLYTNSVGQFLPAFLANLFARQGLLLITSNYDPGARYHMFIS